MREGLSLNRRKKLEENKKGCLAEKKIVDGILSQRYGELACTLQRNQKYWLSLG